MNPNRLFDLDAEVAAVRRQFGSATPDGIAKPVSVARRSSTVAADETSITQEVPVAYAQRSKRSRGVVVTRPWALGGPFTGMGYPKPAKLATLGIS